MMYTYDFFQMGFLLTQFTADAPTYPGSTTFGNTVFSPVYGMLRAMCITQSPISTTLTTNSHSILAVMFLVNPTKSKHLPLHYALNDKSLLQIVHVG